MFWKKKKPVTDTIEYSSDNLRAAYRYPFKKGRELLIKFKGQTVQVHNIGAGGIAFTNKGFKISDVDRVRFTLDIPDIKGNSTVFSADLRILSIDGNNICHSVFEHCPAERSELIHKYVLEQQKNDLAH